MPNCLEDRWLEQVATASSRIVLADGDDPRVRAAAGRLVDAGLVPIVVSAAPTPSGVERLDPIDPGIEVSRVIDDALHHMNAKRPLTEIERSSLAADPVIVGAAAVRGGQADGCVAGASRTSGAVASAALRVLGMATGHLSLSGSFILEMPDGRVFAYGDCAVIPEPDTRQLADVACATADTFGALTGIAPRVALLSFSTRGSADHPSIAPVREAVEMVRRERPDIIVDGELQFDAAAVPSVAEVKAPSSPVAGLANVFIFPNLAAANIAYKITERLGAARAYGPLFQGLRAPMNDLSRGCTEHDVFTVSLITAVQAAKLTNHFPNQRA